ncbi:hypothetical protein [Helicobacter vulpis]|uniref:hypothetical protein n=1 Tax=Helicobacter vulpis TaxID=2316076 RepID=UPI000EB17C90|nr:hypothetical protein [Helicobacter vulpis]
MGKEEKMVLVDSAFHWSMLIYLCTMWVFGHLAAQPERIDFVIDPGSSIFVWTAFVLGTFLNECLYRFKWKKWRFQSTLGMLLALVPIALIHFLFDTPPWLEGLFLLGIVLINNKLIVPRVAFLRSKEEDTPVNTGISSLRAVFYYSALVTFADKAGDEAQGFNYFIDPRNSVFIGAALVVGAFFGDCFCSLKGKLAADFKFQPRPIKWQFQPTLEMLLALVPIALIHFLCNTPPWLEGLFLLGVYLLYRGAILPKMAFLRTASS